MSYGHGPSYGAPPPMRGPGPGPGYGRPPPRARPPPQPAYEYNYNSPQPYAPAQGPARGGYEGYADIAHAGPYGNAQQGYGNGNSEPYPSDPYGHTSNGNGNGHYPDQYAAEQNSAGWDYNRPDQYSSPRHSYDNPPPAGHAAAAPYQAYPPQPYQQNPPPQSPPSIRPDPRAGSQGPPPAARERNPRYAATERPLRANMPPQFYGSQTGPVYGGSFMPSHTSSPAPAQPYSTPPPQQQQQQQQARWPARDDPNQPPSHPRTRSSEQTADQWSQYQQHDQYQYHNNNQQPSPPQQRTSNGQDATSRLQRPSLQSRSSDGHDAHSRSQQLSFQSRSSDGQDASNKYQRHSPQRKPLVDASEPKQLNYDNPFPIFPTGKSVASATTSPPASSPPRRRSDEPASQQNGDYSASQVPGHNQPSHPSTASTRPPAKPMAPINTNFSRLAPPPAIQSATSIPSALGHTQGMPPRADSSMDGPLPQPRAPYAVPERPGSAPGFRSASMRDAAPALDPPRPGFGGGGHQHTQSYSAGPSGTPMPNFDNARPTQTPTDLRRANVPEFEQTSRTAPGPTYQDGRANGRPDDFHTSPPQPGLHRAATSYPDEPHMPPLQRHWTADNYRQDSVPHGAGTAPGSAPPSRAGPSRSAYDDGRDARGYPPDRNGIGTPRNGALPYRDAAPNGLSQRTSPPGAIPPAGTSFGAARGPAPAGPLPFPPSGRPGHAPPRRGPPPGAGSASDRGMGMQPPGAMPERQQSLPVSRPPRTDSDPQLQTPTPPSAPAQAQRPPPVRPGLAPNGPMSSSRPPPVRQYDNPTAGATGGQPARQPSEPAGAAGAPAKPAITVGELNRMREAARARPNDQRTQMDLARKLVEASVELADEGGRADARTASRNKLNYASEAHKIIKRLVASGYPDAMFFLADSMSSGSLGLENDPKEAFNLYQQAAKAGHGPAAYRTAVCCEIGPEEGGGTRKDPVKAMQWYRRAAALGDVPAMYKLGMIQMNGLLGQPRSTVEGCTWLKRAADKADADNPHALHELGIIYETGTGPGNIPQDGPKAYELFHAAARFGYRASQFKLGQAFEYGLLGCGVDARNSIVWYTRAAAQGEHNAELALSGWYLTGAEGILEQSDTEAYLWARKAASAAAPLPKAMFAMGYFTEVGIGCPSSADEAKRWYTRAASHRFPKALERLEELKRGGPRALRDREKLSRSNPKQNADCSVM